MKKRMVWLVAIAVLFLAIVAISNSAAGQDENDTVIYACVKPGAGQLVLADPETNTCKGNEVLVWWNQRGPIGPQGLQGPPGVSWYDADVYRMPVQKFGPIPLEPYSAGEQYYQMYCHPGDIMLSAGYNVWPREKYVRVVTSAIWVDATGRDMYVLRANSTDPDSYIYGYVRCIDVPENATKSDSAASPQLSESLELDMLLAP